MITTNYKSALLALVHTNRKGHLLPVAAPAANLARVSWVHFFKRPASVLSFAFRYREKLSPSHVNYSFRKMMVLDHPANVQILDGDMIELLNQLRRFFVMKMFARSLNSQVSKRDSPARLLPVLTALLLSRQVALFARKLIFHLFQAARVLNLFARAQCGEAGDSDIHADTGARLRKGVRFGEIANKQCVPTVSPARNHELFTAAFNWAAKPYTASSDSGNRQLVAFDRARPDFLDLLRKSVIPVTRLEPGKTRFFTRVQTPKECVKREVQALQSVALNRAQNTPDFRQFTPRFGQLPRLLVKTDPLTAGFIDANPLFKGAVINKAGSVERPLATRDELLIRANSVLECLCDNLGISHCVTIHSIVAQWSGSVGCSNNLLTCLTIPHIQNPKTKFGGNANPSARQKKALARSGSAAPSGAAARSQPHPGHALSMDSLGKIDLPPDPS
jgi:hypothetical protein